MKWTVLGIGLALAGCRQASQSVRPPRLTNAAIRSLNGKLHKLEFRWDLGTRPVRAVRYKGGSLAGRLTGSQAMTTLLKVELTALDMDRATLRVELSEREENASSTTEVASKISVDGGLESLEATPKLETASDGSVILLRWRDPKAKAPATVVATFR